MGLTVLIVPMYAPYNQVLLLPAILVLVRDRRMLTARSLGVRSAYGTGAFALAWQWTASLVLSAAYLLGAKAWAFRGWKWPFFTTFTLPVFVFALTFLHVQSQARGVRAQEGP